MKFTYNEKENALLDAAMSLFIRYGYDKTTVEEIAKKAGIISRNLIVESNNFIRNIL